MLFKRNDKIAIVVKPKTHNGEINEKDYFTRYGEMRKDCKFLVSKNILTFWDTQKDNFRSFNLSDVVSITNLSRTPLEINKKEKEKQEREKMKKITDEELISFFNNLKEIIQAQKELNHVLHKRIGNLEERLSKKEREVVDVV